MTPNQTKTKQIHIFVNRSKVETQQQTVTGAGLLLLAGFDGSEWDLFALQGEGDPSGGELLMQDTPIDLKNGARFRVIPGNRTFGAQS